MNTPRYYTAAHRQLAEAFNTAPPSTWSAAEAQMVLSIVDNIILRRDARSRRVPPPSGDCPRTLVLRMHAALAIVPPKDWTAQQGALAAELYEFMAATSANAQHEPCPVLQLVRP